MPVPAEILRTYNAQRTCSDKGTLCHAPESSMYFGRDGAVKRLLLQPQCRVRPLP